MILAFLLTICLLRKLASYLCKIYLGMDGSLILHFIMYSLKQRYSPLLEQCALYKSQQRKRTANGVPYNCPAKECGAFVTAVTRTEEKQQPDLQRRTKLSKHRKQKETSFSKKDTSHRTKSFQTWGRWRRVLWVTVTHRRHTDNSFPIPKHCFYLGLLIAGYQELMLKLICQLTCFYLQSQLFCFNSET